MQYVLYTPLLPLNIYFLFPHSTTPSLPFRSNFKSRAPFTHLRHMIRIESNVLEKRAIYTSQFGTRLRNVSGTQFISRFSSFSDSFEFTKILRASITCAPFSMAEFSRLAHRVLRKVGAARDSSSKERSSRALRKTSIIRSTGSGESRVSLSHNCVKAASIVNPGVKYFIDLRAKKWWKRAHSFSFLAILADSPRFAFRFSLPVHEEHACSTTC